MAWRSSAPLGGALLWVAVSAGFRRMPWDRTDSTPQSCRSQAERLLLAVHGEGGPLADPGQIGVAGRVVPVRQNNAVHGRCRPRVNPAMRFGVAIREGNHSPTVVQ